MLPPFEIHFKWVFLYPKTEHIFFKREETLFGKRKTPVVDVFYQAYFGHFHLLRT